MNDRLSRRNLLKMTGAAIAAGVVTRVGGISPTWAAESAGSGLKKAVGYGMIGIQGSVLDKFNLIKSLGFEGVEIDAPSGLDRNEVIQARDKSGIVIHGVVDSIHWNQRLSDPDPAVRAKGLEGLKTALNDAKFYGASTVLLVPGAVRDPQKESFEQCWARSQEEIRKAIPLAEKLDVKIAIEVVWNNFITKPEQLVQYVDEFSNPIVGAYYDVGNMIKYGVPPAQWIRALGKRMYKLHIKSYHMQKQWVAIGDGDENFPEVRKAINEIGYRGWVTAEVGGGGAEILKDIAQRMNRELGIL